MSLKTKKEQEESVIYFALKCRELRGKIKELQDTENRFKEELRGLMNEYEIKHLKNEVVDVEIRYPKSFDPGQLGVDYPELYQKYVKIEKVIVESEKMTINEKDLKRFHPKEYEHCIAEGTPRLYIK